MSAVRPTNRQLDELDRRLLDLLAVDGRATMSELGRVVGLSRTAETHRTNLLRKLGLQTQTDLVRFAIRKGLIQP